MGNVDEGARRVDPEDHPFHRSHIMVLSSKVSEESDDAAFHLAYNQVRSSEFRVRRLKNCYYLSPASFELAEITGKTSLDCLSRIVLSTIRLKNSSPP